MEPVRIACPSCRGKLVVRSEWLLGQTVICPRCKSNVQLPTSGASTSSSAVVAPVTYDSTAITRVDDGQLAQRLADALDGTGGLLDLDGQTFESAIEAFRPLHEDISGSNLSSTRARDRSVDEPVSMGAAARVDGLADTKMASWNPAATRRVRQVLMIAVAGIATTLVALGGFVVFLVHHSNQAVVAQKPFQQIPNQPPPNQQIPDEPSVEVVPQVVIEPVDVEQKNIDAVASLSPEQTPLAEPPAVLPTKISASPTNSDVPANLEIPDAMKRFSQVFDPGSLTLFPDAFGTEKPTVGPETGSEKIDIETLHHPPPVIIPSWDDIQAVRIPSFATKNAMPLNELLIVIGQLSGSGLGWELDATRLSGFDVDQPVSLSGQDITIGELIKTLCGEQRLVVTLDSQGLPFFWPNSDEIMRRLPTDWSIGDLATENASLVAWQELLKKFFPTWSDRWQLRGTELQWSETASSIQQATVAAFLDQIRLAHGLQLKSTLPETVTDPRLGLDASLARLAKSGTRIIEHAMSLPQLLDIAARDAELKLMFDWGMLSSHGFSHAKGATSLLRGRNWSEIAKWGLDEFSLVAVVDGSDRIVLTTLPQQRRMWRNLLIKLDTGKTLESIRESLRMLSPTDEQGRSMLLVSSLPQVGEAPSPWVAVRLCPPNTFQLQSRVLREALKLPILQRKTP